MRPRPILHGVTYLVTRRCTQRQFLLRPSKRTNEAFAYALAYAAMQTGVEVHAVCVLSNHWHAVVTDHDGRVPDFCQLLHVLVAKQINASLGRWENLWDNRQPSYVRLRTNDDIVDKISYTLNNPVAAHLVDKGHHWPGLRLVTGKQVTVERPRHYFRPDGDMPEKITLRLTAPSGSNPGVVMRHVYAREAELRAKRRLNGMRVMGVKAIRAQSPFDAPTSFDKRQGVSPEVASHDKWARIEALQQRRAFHSIYRFALRQWRAGVRDARFPAGTFSMKRLHNVSCM